MNRHLGTLSVLHYVYGVFTCLAGATMLALVFMGVFLNSDFVAQQEETPPPTWLGGFFQVFGWALFVLVEVIGILIISSGRWIAKRRNRTGSLIIAGLCCLNFPLGMALGVFTFIVLLNQEVQDEYAATKPI
ncbi:MAG: hypothetical protein IPM46_04025 [Flavobacteriales bacterium]|nr:hypothetical protein [Flavobacteriales bacterium]